MNAEKCYQCQFCGAACHATEGVLPLFQWGSTACMNVPCHVPVCRCLQEESAFTGVASQCLSVLVLGINTHLDICLQVCGCVYHCKVHRA